MRRQKKRSPLRAIFRKRATYKIILKSLYWLYIIIIENNKMWIKYYKNQLMQYAIRHNNLHKM